jgi:hypothetical protein
VDLVPPAAAGAQAAWPEPVCPQGVVGAPGDPTGGAEPEPGGSPLDEGLRQLGAVGRPAGAGNPAEPAAGADQEGGEA